MRLARRATVAALAVGLTLAGAAVAAPGAAAVTLRPLPVPNGRYCTVASGHAPVSAGHATLPGRACSGLYYLDAPR